MDWIKNKKNNYKKYVMSEKKTNDKLIYVEPNFENAYQDVNNNGLIPFAPDLTDFCISVDLEVEVRSREVIAKGKSDKKLITMSWNNSSSGNTVSFMQGTTINFDRGGDKSGFVNSLTTSYTDIFYNDIKDDGTNEMFGISSIDIDYNNYFVPQITINFIDIRGVSLFAPEELRHSDSRDGIGGFSNDDVAGSFFKCFFTFPYPKFRLRVKGFYGQPVSYELTCSDFRATFDSNTGNFGAKATFIGYAFSLLNDVTLNALSVAPLSDYLGRDYWESKLNTTFTVKDAYGNDAPMLTLSQLIIALKDAKKDLSRIGSSSPIHQEQTKLQKQIEALNIVSIKYNGFINDILTKLDKNKPSFANNGENSDIYTLFRQYNNKGFIILSNNSSDKIENYIKVSEYEELNSAIANYNALSNNGLFNNKISELKGSFVQILKLNNNGKLDFYKDSSAKSRLDIIFQNDSNLKNNINNVILANNKKDIEKRVLNSYVYGFLYSDNGLVDKISELQTELQTAINKNQKDVTQFENESLAKSVGFIPNVYNITKIIMAHLETLMHMLYTTADNVGDRTANSMNINLGDTDVNLKSNTIPPFPKITIESYTKTNKKENNTDEQEYKSNAKHVDRWIGECTGNVPERDLVHGLLNGVQQLFSNSLDYANDLKNSDSDGVAHTASVKIPLTPLDMLLTKNPFGNTIDFKDISDFIGRVIYRMYETLSLPNFDDDWDNQASILGKADAINFATLFKIPSNDFIRRLNLPEFTPDFMLDVAMNSKKGNIQNERINNRWAWDGDSVDNYPLIIKINGSPSLNLYKVSDGNNIVNYVMPLQSSTFSEVINDMSIKNNLTGGMPKDLNNFFTTSDLMTGNKKITSNPNLFLIDENVEKYSILMQQIKMDGNDMSKISSYFNCIYDSNKYGRYFKSSKTFGTTLIFSNNDIDFSPKYGNRLLSSSKRTQNEISEVNVFSEQPKSLMYLTFEGLIDIRERKRDFGFGNVFNDLNSIGDYTIPTFDGYIVDGVFVESLKVSIKACLFGQYCYYLQNQASDSQLVKSLMFLDTLGGLDFDDLVDDLCDNKENAIFIAPKVGALLCGAYLWRYEKMSSNGNVDVVIKDEYFTFDAKSNERLNSDEINNKLFKLRNEIKQYLINYFIKWTETDFSVNIQSEFELRTEKGVVSAAFIKELSYNMLIWADGSKFKLDGYINLEDYLTKTFSDNFFRNYISISRTDTQGNQGHSVKLYNRELSNAVIYATNLYVTPCVILKSTKYIFNDQDSRLPILKNGVEKVYLTSFIRELKKQYEPIKNSLSTLSLSAPIANETNTDVNIKIALYKYCKLIYDRWVGGTKFDEWTLENFFEEHFHFIDAYYNKIGNDALVNLSDVVERLISSNTQNEYSLLSFLSDVLAKSSFQLLCIQNFSNLSDKSKMTEMFKPISYNEMAEAKIHPDFVVMYSYEYSHNLDIENSEYSNDGLMITSADENFWPAVIKNKDMDNGYTIPAFGVSYGSQYQSYFSDINVSMESPMVTEQSIKAQYLIAGEHNPSSDENGRDKVFLGQDLFTIYSNNSYTCTVTMMGCAWVQPLMYFCLLNIPLFRGAYLIQKVTHHMEPGNMTTTITGVRMCGTATPLVNRWYYEKINNEAGGINTQAQTKKEEVKRLASIDNDCEYKIFPTVYQSSNGPTLNLQELKEYKDLRWLDVFKFDNNDYENLYQAIMATIVAETGGDNGGEGELGAKLATVVMINRLMDNNGNWEKVLVKGQMAVGVRKFSGIGNSDNTPKEGYKELFGWVEDVLTNGPTIIVGRDTEVNNPVPIYNLGKPTGKETTSTKITLDDVQKIYMYCTTNGYGPRKEGQPVERTVAYWRDSEYFLHHKGHVFTGHMKHTNESIHWKAEPKKSNQNESELSDLAQGVLEAMKKTAKISENVNIDIIGKKLGNNMNEMVLTCDKKDKMSSIFDIALNGYYDNFSKIFWVVENDNKMSDDNPLSVIVEVKDSKTDYQPNRSVGVVRNGSYDIIKNHNNLSKLFYRSLSKKYKPLTSQDVLNIFKIEAKNFIDNNGYLYADYSTFLNDNAPSPCPVDN